MRSLEVLASCMRRSRSRNVDLGRPTGNEGYSEPLTFPTDGFRGRHRCRYSPVALGARKDVSLGEMGTRCSRTWLERIRCPARTATVALRTGHHGERCSVSATERLTLRDSPC